jgi:uncharacterized coiled-coil protein SlyX
MDTSNVIGGLEPEVLTRAFGKSRRKEPLTSEEGAALAIYNRSRKKLRTDVYWTDLEEKESMLQFAKAAGGADFSKWMRSMVYRGLNSSNRTAEEWQQMEDRILVLEQRLVDQAAVMQELAQAAVAHRSRYEQSQAEVVQLKRQLEM